MPASDPVGAQLTPNPHRRLLGGAWEVTCDVCRLGSSDCETAEQAVTVAVAEGFLKLPDGRWICDVRDEVHVNREKTHCDHGHDFSVHGATRTNGNRYCKACSLRMSTRYYTKHRDSVLAKDRTRYANGGNVARHERHVRDQARRLAEQHQ